jgi:hypothetical protein
MDPKNTLTWRAYEYEPRRKSYTWFWVLGIIGAGAFLAAIFLENFLFAVLIFISVMLLALFAARKPQLVTFEVTESSLSIDSRTYPLKELKTFWITEDIPENAKLLIEARGTFIPLLCIPLNDVHPDNIRAMLKTKLHEEELYEPIAHHILDRLGL